METRFNQRQNINPLLERIQIGILIIVISTRLTCIQLDLKSAKNHNPL